MEQKHYDSEVAARSLEVMQAIVDSGSLGVWTAHAFLELGAASPDELSDAIERYLEVPTFSSSESIAGGPFHVLPAALLVCRWESSLPTRAVERIRRFFLEGVIDRGNTENHWLMHYTGCLLAAERWSDAKTMWNGLSRGWIRKTAPSSGASERPADRSGKGQGNAQ